MKMLTHFSMMDIFGDMAIQSHAGLRDLVHDLACDLVRDLARGHEGV